MVKSVELDTTSFDNLISQQFRSPWKFVYVGGADKGSTLVVGPEDGRGKTITPIEHILDNVHEVVGAGTIFPNEKDEPILHMHIASGRQSNTVTGCVRNGVKAWHILEIILIELVGAKARRALYPITGFELLKP